MVCRARVTFGEDLEMHTAPAVALGLSLRGLNAVAHFRSPEWGMHLGGKLLLSSAARTVTVDGREPGVMELQTLPMAKGVSWQITCEGEQAEEAILRLRAALAERRILGDSTFEILK